MKREENDLSFFALSEEENHHHAPMHPPNDAKMSQRE